MNSLDSYSFLEEALSSVAAQTVLPREVVFFENGLGDQTKHIIDAYSQLNIRFIRHAPRLSLYEARVEAINLCTSSLIAFLDCDDVWMPRKLERQIPIFADSCVAICSGSAAVISFTGSRWAWVQNLPTYRGRVSRGNCGVLLKKFLVPWSSAMFCAQALRNCLPGRVPRFNLIEDFDIVYRALKFGDLVPLKGDPLCVYRIHGTNASRNEHLLIDEMNHWCDEESLKHRGKSRDRLLSRVRSINQRNHAGMVFFWGNGKRSEARELLKNTDFGLLWIKIVIYAYSPLSRSSLKRIRGSFSRLVR